MNLQVIDKAFSDMIHQKGIEEKLGVDRNYVYQLRNKIKNAIGISLDTKLELLKKTGWKESEAKFSWDDIVDVVTFTIKQGAKAKEFGPTYIAEKWKGKK